VCEHIGGEKWDCTASMPKQYRSVPAAPTSLMHACAHTRGRRLSVASLSCEGWDGPEDPWIVMGSCTLEYNIDHNDYDEL
jgi:hypothetical protein